MKFLCDRCKTRYSIGDDRVRGKILKIRCKNCANVITVREGMPESDAKALVSRSGATVAVSEVVTGGPEDAVHHLVTVVGEIPTATAQRIAQSIRYIAQ